LVINGMNYYIVTTLEAGWWRVWSLQWQWIFLSSNISTLVVGPTQPPIQRVREPVG